MSSRCPKSLSRVCAGAAILLGAFFCSGALAENAPATGERVLRVAADPNNLPFSNDKLEGFENEIVALVARELHAKVEYVWWAQRRGFFRNMLKEHRADLVAGVPVHFDLALTTAPYYESGYVFVTRAADKLDLHSLDDPRLRQLRIGVQMIGNDGMNTPPAHALARRGIVANVKGYTLYGDYRQPNPPARIVEAVARGDIDVALVWGPLAGYFAPRQPVPLALAPLPESPDDQPLRFRFKIAMGVARNEPALRDELNAVLEKNHDAINAILAKYGVPRASS